MIDGVRGEVYSQLIESKLDVFINSVYNYFYILLLLLLLLSAFIIIIIIITGHKKLNPMSIIFIGAMYIQSNFNGSNTYGTMKISSRQG